MPLIVFAATRGGDEVAQILDAGGDDVVSATVAMPELLARVRAARRRSLVAGRPRVAVGELVLDVGRHAIVRGDQTIKLSAREFQVLEYLLRHQGEVVRREELRRAIWSRERGHESNVVDMYVHYLRTKIKRSGGTQTIQTVAGVGYLLDGPDADRRQPKHVAARRSDGRAVHRRH